MSNSTRIPAGDPLEWLDYLITRGSPTASDNRKAIKKLREMLLKPACIKAEKLYEDAKLPKTQEKGDAGTDLYSCLEEGQHVEIQPGERKLISTGLRLELPPHTELQIRPRSGLALDHGITVLNTPGTVDEGYRGEVGVILINHSEAKALVRHQERIAQAVLKPALAMKYKEIKSVDTNTERGEGGYGHTGNK
jgi:dUTP pyrophosphatase